MGNTAANRENGGIINVKCFACMPGDTILDRNEINIFNDFTQPKGKISEKSIKNLTKLEIDFFKSCAGRNISALRYYLKKKVNVNVLDEERTSPLHVAARTAGFQVVEELINSGV